MAERQADVIVIGAGLAGLTAAYRIKTLQPQCSVLVLEAKDRVGGRTLTVDLKASKGKDKWDLGGQWVCRHQHHILWLLEELGIETYKQFLDGKKLMQLGGNNISTYNSTTPSLPFFSLLDLGRALDKLENMVRQVPRQDPRLSERADEWDKITLETLIDQTAFTRVTKETFDVTIAMISGIRCREISALHFLHYSSTAGSFERLYEAENGGAQEWKVKGGLQQVSELLTDKIGSENVILSEPVTVIDQSDESSIQVTSASGGKYRCKYVINASPLHCAASMDYKPSIPLTRQSLANRSPMGHLFKFIITYKEAFWREKGFSGEIIGNGGAPVLTGCDSGPIQLVFDSVTGYGNPALVGFYANAWQWRLVDFETRKAAVLKHLTEFLGEEAANPLEFIDKDWTSEPFNGGCPVNVATPGALSSFFDGMRTPHDRVHWAGTESATQWNGYLSGAVQSGMRAAEEVLTRINPSMRSDGLLQDLDNKFTEPAQSSSGYSGIALAVGSVLVAGLCMLMYWFLAE